MSSPAIPIPGPLSIGDIIDRAFRISRARFKPMLMTALALLVPLAVLTGVLSYFVNEQSLRSTASGDLAGSLGASISSLLLALLAWLIQGLAELALTFHALAALRNEGMEPREAVLAAGSRIRSWLGMSVLRGLVFGALLLVLILPSLLLVFAAANDASPVAAIGLSCFIVLAMLVMLVLVVILQTRWLVCTSSLVIEHLGARASLGRSWGLTRGKFWRSFGVMFVLGLIALIVLSLPNFVIQMVALFGTERSALWSAAGTVLGTILSSLFVPLSAATYVVLYYDLRVRRENLDLDVRVQQLELETSGLEEAQP